MKTLSDIMPGIIEFRKELHRHPELAGKENWTCQAIRERLAKNAPNLEVLPPFLGTDTVAILRGAKPGPEICLRADIDALEIAEENDIDFASLNPGLMHACGHDVHTASLMAAAEYLSSIKDQIAGTVRFVWQPGEENIAMGKDLVAAGALGTSNSVAAFHVSPFHEVGEIGYKVGPIMGGSAHFEVKIKGKSGHGSRLDRTRNPVTAGAAIVSELQSVVANRISPLSSGVLSICCFQGGHLPNVVPDEAHFTGTLRYLDDETCEELITALKEVSTGVAAAHRVTAEVIIEAVYPSTVNTEKETMLAKKVLDTIPGITTYEEPEPSMGAEDFSFYLKKLPGTYLRVGSGCNVPLHNSRYLPKEETLEVGAKYLIEYTLEALKN